MDDIKLDLIAKASEEFKAAAASVNMSTERYQVVKSKKSQSDTDSSITNTLIFKDTVEEVQYIMSVTVSAAAVKNTKGVPNEAKLLVMQSAITDFLKNAYKCLE